MSVPAEYKYTRTHEWVRVDGDIVTIGITDYAQNELGDITYLELPGVGEVFSQADSFGVVESVKAASDIYAPVSGEVVEGNVDVEDAPELVNQSPFDEAWLIRLRISDPNELTGLMGAEEYNTFIEAGGH